MSGVYGVLQTGMRSLLAQQRGIEVAGHNIANVNTPGYSRQTVNLQTTTPVMTSQGMIGTGVTAREFQRVYDRFVGVQIENAMEEQGRWEAQKTALERVEIIFDESSDSGLSKTMGEFWNVWQDLVNNPSGNVERLALLGSSETLAFEFQNTYNNLSPLQHDLDISIASTVDEINLKAAEIATLNQKIIEVEGGGFHANDFRDARDLAVKEISLMIDVTTYEESSGSINVSLRDGSSLVSGSNTSDLSTMVNDSGHRDVVWASDATVSINSKISGGKLKGWIEARDVIIPGYMSNLEDLADGIKEAVNTAHGNGYDLNGAAGGDFFSGTLAAGTFAVASAIAADVNKIAASGTAAGVPGDNSNAIAIAELQNALMMNSNTTNFDDYYNSMVSDVGTKVRQAAMSYDHHTAMVSHLENYRESISGVSIDEEMINLVQFQHGYEAAAKLISTTDELLQTLINMV
ncbi:MAG: flagellar hook-associated protein FlgK [Desulfobacteraceae bacterium]|nr:flagellar hook-associated protein FlgK [Desulfobacteraceae bacterium]